jgi:hypothetical protein
MHHESSVASSHCTKMSFDDTKNHMINIFPKVYLNNLNGFDPTRWVSRMEHYVSLYGINDEQPKLQVGVLYLDKDIHIGGNGK